MLKRTGIVIIALIFMAFVNWAPAAAEEPGVRIERTTVSGMTILLQRTESEMAEIALLLKSGSGLDPAGKRGTAEIMNSLVYLNLRYGGDALGEIDVGTYPDYTLIRIRTTARGVDDGLKAVKNLLTYPLYSYDVTTDLKSLYQTDLKALPALNKCYYDFNREFYGANHPYDDGLDPATIPAIGGRDVYQWYRRTYQPGNAVLSVAGGVRQSIGDLEKFFAGMRTESVDRRLLVQPVSLDASRRLDRTDPNGRVASVAIGFPAPRIQDPEFPAFRIIAYYLEEYQHYFEALRVKHALFYSGFVYYNYLQKPKAPTLTFLTFTDPDLLGAVEDKTVELVRDLSEQGIASDEVARVIKAIRAGIDARKQDGRGLAARNLLSFYLESQWIDDEKLLPRLEQVQSEEIRQAAAKYLQNYIRVAYVPETLEQDF
jgi:predicted Zn-dependent peptidase